MFVTSISHPKTASTIDIYFWIKLSLPSLLNSGCLLTLIFTFKSPFMLPFPLNFNVAPSWIPLGTRIYSWLYNVTIPFPEHVPHGDVIFTPSPLHPWHYIRIIISPCRIVINPVPWQVPHFWGFVPGLDFVPLHVPQVLTRLYLIV